MFKLCTFHITEPLGNMETCCKVATFLCLQTSNPPFCGGFYIWVFPKIMLHPNHPFYIIGFSIIFTIRFGGFPPGFGNTHILLGDRKSNLLGGKKRRIIIAATSRSEPVQSTRTGLAKLAQCFSPLENEQTKSLHN